MGVESPPQPHNFVNFGLIWSCVGTFILTTAFNALGGSGAGVPDVFYATVGDISDVYQLFITPAGRDHENFDIDFHSFLFSLCETFLTAKLHLDVLSTLCYPNKL